MEKNLYIDASHPDETRVVLKSTNHIEEYEYESKNRPYLKNNIILIIVLISLEIIKELPITLILRPFNFETFATTAYIYASQDLLEAAAAPSIFLILIASMFILFVSRYILSDK